VFKAEFPKGLEDRHSACVVQLEAENKNLKKFTTIAANRCDHHSGTYPTDPPSRQGKERVRENVPLLSD